MTVLRGLAARLQRPCARGCGEMGRCDACIARFDIGRKLQRLVDAPEPEEAEA